MDRSRSLNLRWMACIQISEGVFDLLIVATNQKMNDGKWLAGVASISTYVARFFMKLVPKWRGEDDGPYRLLLTVGSRSGLWLRLELSEVVLRWSVHIRKGSKTFIGSLRCSSMSRNARDASKWRNDGGAQVRQR
jgi:hypothetical protein